MAKLSKIFENIENSAYEKEKYHYFAEKLFESLKLEEGLSKNGFKIEQVEEKILSEALKYSSEKEAIDFLKEQKLIVMVIIMFMVLLLVEVFLVVL